MGERLVFVMPPVDTEALRPDEGLRRRAREALGVPSDSVVVGTLAARYPQKGIEWLLRAAATVRAPGSSAVFRIIGKASAAHPEYERGLHRAAESLGLRPPALDFVDPADEPHLLLRGLDVFALTSVPRSEGIPTVIGEAMALGIPVVTTDVGAVRELVAPDASAIVAPPQDVDAIARAVSRLVGDEDMRRRMGAAGREIAERRLGLDRVADVHAAAYELAIRQRRNRRR